MNRAFLLTAGVGSRLHPHTKRLPKSSIPFLSLPLCYYSFFLCHKTGIQNYLFNVHHLPEQTKATVEKLSSFAHSIDISDETKEILGSGGAFAGAKNILNKNSAFLVANGDEVMIPQDSNILSSLIDCFARDQSLACLLVTDHPDLQKTLKPVWINNNNEVLGFGMEEPEGDCRPVHFTGYKVYNSQILEFIPQGVSNIFYDILTKRIASGDKITTYYVKDLPWFETGNFESYLQASKNCLQIIQRGNSQYFKEIFKFYGKNLENWHILQKNNDYLFKPKSVEIPKNLSWKGLVCLDEGVTINDALELENVIVSKNIQIAESTKNCFL